ncbi:hypothetical protein LZ31DRAFT_194622 [Colletotrichum somersetense]|nr:hypothetical protein LZ31DRAFT_194622 [Colletotrichum somersetense]
MNAGHWAVDRIPPCTTGPRGMPDIASRSSSQRLPEPAVGWWLSDLLARLQDIRLSVHRTRRASSCCHVLQSEAPGGFCLCLRCCKSSLTACVACPCLVRSTLHRMYPEHDGNVPGQKAMLVLHRVDASHSDSLSVNKSCSTLHSLESRPAIVGPSELCQPYAASFQSITAPRH